MLINSSDKFISYMNKTIIYAKYADKTNYIEDDNKVNRIMNEYGEVFRNRITTEKKQVINEKNNSSFKHNKLLLSNKKY